MSEKRKRGVNTKRINVRNSREHYPNTKMARIDSVQESDSLSAGTSTNQFVQTDLLPCAPQVAVVPSALYPFRMGLGEVAGIIPEFSPGSPNSLSTPEWINLIENSKMIYNWDDHLTLLYASSRLRGAAQWWHQSRKVVHDNWSHFKTDLLEGFPYRVDETSIHCKLMKRKRKYDEPVEMYFYEILALAKRGGLSEQSTIKYVISGLGDRNLVNVLTAASCTTTNDLLKQIKFYESIQEQERNRSIIDRYRPKTVEREANTNAKRTVFNPIKNFEAPKRVKGFMGNCFKCGQQGHKSVVCPRVNKINQRLPVYRSEPPKNVNVIREGNRELYRTIRIDNHDCEAFIDLGSECSTIRLKECKNNEWDVESGGMVLRGFAGGRCTTLGQITKIVSVGDVEQQLKLSVVEDNVQETPVIIGQDFLNRPGIRVVKSWGKLEILKDASNLVDNCDEAIDLTKEAKQMQITKRPIELEDLKIGELGTENITDMLMALVRDYRDCFALEMEELGCTDILEMKIELKEKSVVKYKPYRVPYHQEIELKKIIEELFRCDIIENSDSEYASPTVLVKKKDGTVRMCVDYRRLNAVTKREQFPTPNIEESLNKMAGGKVFVSLDMASGYYQIPIASDSKQYTAFVTPSGHYQFKRMPFGLTNAPAVFMRIMNELAKEINDERVHIYMDDWLLVASSVEEVLGLFQKVLNVLKRANLALNVKKCVFFTNNVTFLGHEICGEGVKPGNGKTEAIREYPVPTTVREVRQFLGLTGYFRRFIQDYARLALPLNQLLKKDVPFNWTETQQQSFDSLKQKLSSKPVLALYEPNARHELHTDACSKGLAAILVQISSDDSKRVVSYFSRRTTSQEQKYHSYELEALAVVEGLERFKFYLLGKHFLVVTDCSALRATQTKKDIVPRIARWWLKLQEFDMELVHRSGTKMTHVDALSRTATGHAADVNEAGHDIMVVMLPQSDWVVSLQMQDKELENIMNILSNSKHKDIRRYRKEYELKDGRLCYKTKEGLKFVVPKGIRWQIVKTCHDGLGHLGLERTLSQIRKTYWFPRMSGFVRKYIDNCIPCAYNKRGKDETNITLNNFETKPVPFHLIHMDHLGPYPKSSKGNTHLLGVIDSFSKFVILRAVRNTSTNYVIKVLNELTQFFGSPAKIVTDRGTAFTSKLFSQYCQNNHITHLKTAVQTPRANGQIERYFRTISEAISTTTSRVDGKDWDVHLNEIQWGLNSVAHKVTGQSPQKLLLGYEPRNFLHNDLTAVLHGEITNERDDQPDLEELRKEVANKIQLERSKQVKRANARHIAPRQYKEGELVLIRGEQAATGQPRKHMPKYKGPYIVEKVLGKDRYSIADPPGIQVSSRSFRSTYAADRMKPWGNLEQLKESEEGLESDSDDDEPKENDPNVNNTSMQ